MLFPSVKCDKCGKYPSTKTALAGTEVVSKRGRLHIMSVRTILAAGNTERTCQLFPVVDRKNVKALLLRNICALIASAVHIIHNVSDVERVDTTNILKFNVC